MERVKVEDLGIMGKSFSNGLTLFHTKEQVNYFYNGRVDCLGTSSKKSYGVLGDHLYSLSDAGVIERFNLITKEVMYICTLKYMDDLTYINSVVGNDVNTLFMLVTHIADDRGNTIITINPEGLLRNHLRVSIFNVNVLVIAEVMDRLDGPNENSIYRSVVFHVFTVPDFTKVYESDRIPVTIFRNVTDAKSLKFNLKRRKTADKHTDQTIAQSCHVLSANTLLIDCKLITILRPE